MDGDDAMIVKRETSSIPFAFHSTFLLLVRNFFLIIVLRSLLVPWIMHIKRFLKFFYDDDDEISLLIERVSVSGNREAIESIRTTAREELSETWVLSREITELCLTFFFFVFLSRIVFLLFHSIFHHHQTMDRKYLEVYRMFIAVKWKRSAKSNY